MTTFSETMARVTWLNEAQNSIARNKKIAKLDCATCGIASHRIASHRLDHLITKTKTVICCLSELDKKSTLNICASIATIGVDTTDILMLCASQADVDNLNIF